MAPDVPLTVDHVIPTALGGSDEPANLVTACQDCNAGKSSIQPDQPIVEDVAKDALRWKAAIEQAAIELDAESSVATLAVDAFIEAWEEAARLTFYGRRVPLPGDWRSSIERFAALGLSTDRIISHVHRTIAKPGLFFPEAFKWFCGCCWRDIADLQESARRIIESQEAE